MGLPGREGRGLSRSRSTFVVVVVVADPKVRADAVVFIVPAEVPGRLTPMASGPNPLQLPLPAPPLRDLEAREEDFDGLSAGAEVDVGAVVDVEEAGPAMSVWAP